MLQVGGKLLSFLIGLQGFNWGEANSGYIIACGQVIESMGCVRDALRGGGHEQVNGEGGDEEWHVEGQGQTTRRGRVAGQRRWVEHRGPAPGGQQHIP